MILVTGATGFIGRSLMRRLEQEGLEARAYTGRVNDPLRLRQELAGIEVVYHLAGAELRGRRRALQHVDVEGTARLIEESRRAGVDHLVVMSRLRADPNSLHPLLRAKGEVERQVRQSGVPYTIVRSATLFGMDDRFLNVIAGLAAWSWPFVWLPGGGETPFQPFWVEDLGRCLVDVLRQPALRGETVSVAGEERFSYRELAQLVLHTTGMRRIPLPVNIRIMRPLNRLLMGWWLYPPVPGFFMDRFSVPDIAPIDSVLRAFHYRPERLVDHIAYLRRPHRGRYLFRL